MRTPGARTENGGMDEHRPAASIQVAPAQSVDDRIDGNRLPLPEFVGLGRRPQKLDRAATIGIVEIKAACQGNHRMPIAVQIVNGQIDVSGGSGEQDAAARMDSRTSCTGGWPRLTGRSHRDGRRH